jgi:hypothetical protein
MLHQYFDARSGRPLTEEEALKNGILQDGVVRRVRMQDAKMLTFLDAASHRPGFRGSNDGDTFGDYLLRDGRRSAYNDYTRNLEAAYKTKPVTKLGDDEEEQDDDADDVVCLQCAGTGEVGNRTCPACGGEGSLSAEDAASYRAKQNNDRRTVDQMMRDHQRTMASEYDAYEKRISQAWKAGK